MKKQLLFIICMLLAGSMGMFGQSQVIIEENFQKWDESEEIVAPDSCETGFFHHPELTGTLELKTSTGMQDITVTMIKCAVAPECETKKGPSAVSAGYVSLAKIDGLTKGNLATTVDTIGQFIFGPVPQIDSIRFGHSATGNNRGIRIYKSNDGVNWEWATDDEFWDFDTQTGMYSTVAINEEDVYIKFTSGFKKSDETSQYTRLHDLIVYGVPGEVQVGIEKVRNNDIQIKPLSLSGSYQFSGQIEQVKVYNTLGSAIAVDYNKGSNVVSFSNAPKGIYIIKVESNNGYVKTLKVFKN
jgi:hypothetical protein